MSETAIPTEIRGILLPLNSCALLLPNTSVVEIIGYRDPENALADAPDWLLGSVLWQQFQVPVVSFDRLLERAEEAIGHRSRIAICNTLSSNSPFPYLGLVLTSLPHLAKVSQQNIEPSEEDEVGGYVAQQLCINGQEAWIPDLDALETEVIRITKA